MQISLTELGSERLDIKNLARREGLHFSDIGRPRQPTTPTFKFLTPLARVAMLTAV